MSENLLLLNRISRMLMLHGSFVNNIGLLNGKLGISIFFYKYSQVSDKEYYSDFAGELLDEIYAEIHQDHSRDFKDGLSGICWGIEYIIRNGYVDADANEILDELDRQILERDVRRVSDISLETGLNGLAHYVLSRYFGRLDSPMIISNEYINDLISSMSRNGGDRGLINSLECIVKGGSLNYQFDLLDNISVNCVWKEEDIFKINSLGILGNGLTGIALKLLKNLH